LQVVYGQTFEALADRMLTRPERYLSAPRGGILDRHGRPLVTDVPSWDVCVDYRVLAGDADYLRAQARLMLRQGRYPSDLSVADVADQLRVEIAHMWQDLAARAREPVATFIERGEQIRRRVERIREMVRRSSGAPTVLREEREFHPIIEGLDDDAALPIRLELEGRYPWLAVTPSTPRAPSFGQRSIGNSFCRSMSAARGAISSAAKRATSLRSMYGAIEGSSGPMCR